MEERPEHLQHHGDHGADTEQNVRGGLATHEARDHGFQCRGLRRDQDLPQIAGRGFSELKCLGEQDDREARR